MRPDHRLCRTVLAVVPALVALALAAPAPAQGPKALVYCPVGLDTAGCDNVVAALGASGTAFTGGVDRGYDGTGGTVDLATADLAAYAVFVVPSLADDAEMTPYGRLRNATIAARLKGALTGRAAVWSGSPDLGTGSGAAKTALIQSLTAWAAGGSGTGFVSLLDNSEDPARRYDWLAALCSIAVSADTSVASYGAAQALTATGAAIVSPGGQALAYPNMAAFGLHAGSGSTEDAVGMADGVAGAPVLVTAPGAPAPAPAEATAAAPAGPRALVYCPVADPQGCNNVVAALTASGTPFTGGADRGYDGTGGTLDLRTADLSPYGVFVVPSLADGADGQPYALLRDPAVAGRLKPLLSGPVAVWSGTPDLGDSSRAKKNILLLNLARWAAAAQASGARGLVALQDASDSVPARYGWLSLVSGVSLAADTTLDLYSNVQALTPTAVSLLDDGSGLQLGYANMASFGLLPGTGLGADATGGRSSVVVLATSASAGGAGGTIATVTTDKEDYPPGDTVRVTGAGWQPGETVTLLFHEDPTVCTNRTRTLVADQAGRISGTTLVLEAHDVGVRFTLTATGQTSGRIAQATFTDGTMRITDANPLIFSPNQASSAGIKDNTSITAKNQGGGAVTGATVRIRLGTSIGGTLVRTIALSGTLAQNEERVVSWDGKNDAAVFVADGQYTVRATQPQGGSTAENDGNNDKATVVVDNTNPTVAVNSVPNGTTGASMSITGTASDLPAVPGAGLDSIRVVVRRTADNAILATGFASNTGSNFSTWSFSYTPSQTGGQSATATAFDKAGNQSASAAQTFNVVAANVAPVANNDSYTTTEDTPLSVAAPGVLGNDTDANGDALTAQLQGGGTGNGTLSLSADGGFTYTPNANFFGTDQFNYRANDGTTTSQPAQVIITVTPVNDPPSFLKGPDQVVTEGTGAYTVSPWATNISAGPPNEAGQTLTFQVTGNTNPALFAVQPAVSAAGTLTYTLAASGFGTAAITLVLKDNGGTANGGQDTSAPQTFTITVTAANRPPLASANGPYTGAEGSPVSFSSAGSSDPDGDPLTYAWSFGDGGASTDPNPTHTYADNGTFTVTLTVSDDHSHSTVATTSATISNVAPSATALTTNSPVSEGGSITLSLAGVADPSGVDAASLEYAFDCGAGAGYGPFGPTNAATCPTDDNGTRTVRGKVRDKDGGVSGDYSAEATITNVAPTATFAATPTTLDEGGSFTLSLTDPSDPSSADLAAGFSYTFDCGSGYGSPGSAGSTSCSAPDNGTLTVKGRIFDKDGGFTEYTGTVTVNNVAPTVADITTNSPVNEGSAITLSLAGITDPSPVDAAAGFMYAFDCGLGAGFGPYGFSNSASCHTTDNGTRTVRGKARDKDGGESNVVEATVTIDNVPPTATFTAAPTTLNEGASFSLALINPFDPSPVDAVAGFTYAFDCGLGYGPFGTTASASCPTADNGVRSVKGTIRDKDLGATEYTATVTVNNVPPILSAITAPVDPVNISTPVQVSASFTDAGTGDTHTGQIDWGDGTTAATITESNGSGTASGSHLYAGPGVYTIRMTVQDDDGGVSNQSVFQYVVVYDPAAGFVTGGGWINSPLGACRFQACTDATTGRANFGFVSKYLKGANVPTGNTEFQFQAGNLNFKSTVYDWLVVSGSSKASYKGSGTINGTGNYGFLLSVVDGGSSGDKFRIKIWDKTTAAVVYDNQMGDADDATASTTIAGGSIVIHTNTNTASK